MIALWMLHATALAALLGGAAALAEWALRLVGRPVRGVWAAALLLAIALPAARLIPRTAAPAPAAADGLVLDADALLARVRRAPTAGPLQALLAAQVVAAPAAWRSLDRPLAAAWALASLVLGLRLLGVARRTARRVRRWPTEAVDGIHVRVAPDLGPAVFGAVRATVIVPRWALADAGLPLMLAHETAHVRARDPLLLAAGLAAAVLVPWNVATWWMLRRLRLAVELDCDARVLAGAGAHPEAVRRYGALLLDVARRAAPGTTPALLSPTLMATPSTLSRRIHAMTAPRPRRALTRALPAAGAAALLVAAACELPRPTAPKAASRAPLARVGETATAAAGTQAEPVATAELRRVLEQAYPATLRESSGRNQRFWIVQEGSGRVSRVLRGVVAANAPANTRMGDASVMVERDGRFARAELTPAMADGAAGVRADDIAAVNVYKLGPGRLGPDSVQAVWLRLKGADVPSAGPAPLAPGEKARVVLRDGRARVQPLDAAGRPQGAPRELTLRMRADSAAQPIVLLDGREISRDSMPAPDRIASVEVLKGQRALDLFGQRAAAGVVLITSK